MTTEDTENTENNEIIQIKPGYAAPLLAGKTVCQSELHYVAAHNVAAFCSFSISPCSLCPPWFLLFLVAEGASEDFANVSLGELIAKFDYLGNLVASQVLTGIGDYLFL